MPHIHEKIDFAVEVFIVHNGRVLLRMHDKMKVWLGPGGHIELDEDPVQAALRETREEVGLEIELVGVETIGVHSGNLLAPVGIHRHRITPTHEHVALIYFAKSKDDTVAPQKQSDRSDDCRWCTMEDLEKMDLLPETRQYAIAALKKLGSTM